MLNVMRDNLRHLKWVLIVVAVAMLGYLGAYFDPRAYRKGARDWAARIDGETISQEEFIQAARQQDEFYRRLLGQGYETMKKNLKVGSQAMQSLVDRKLVLAEARAMGLETTKEEVSRQIVESPNFRDASGAFIGKDRYTQVVESNVDGGVVAFERQLADDILARKWTGVIGAPASVSDAELESAWRERNEHAAYDYVFVPTSAVPFDTKVDPAAVTAWYDGHKEDYRRPESRRIKILVVDRQAQLGKVKVSDDEVKADYEAHAAEFQRPEQRHARHILFKLKPGATDADKKALRAKAEAALARAQKGEDFAALARSLSEDAGSASKGGDLGWFARGRMVKPFDDAVFAAPVGSLTGVVDTDFGYHVIQVLEERPAGTETFDDVKDSIRRRLELQHAQDAAIAEAQRLRGEIKTAADIDAVAAKAGLKPEVRVVSASDRAADLGPSPEFSAEVASLAAGAVTAPVGVAKGLAIVGCTDVLPPAIQPLSEVTDRVRSDVLNERGRAAALVAARRIDATPGLAPGAASLKLEVKKSGDVNPGAAVPGAGAVPELDRIVFAPETTVGTTGAVAAEGGAVAFRVTRHDTFDASKFQAEKPALREQILGQRREQLVQGVLDALRQKHTIEINEEMVNSING